MVHLMHKLAAMATVSVIALADASAAFAQKAPYTGPITKPGSPTPMSIPDPSKLPGSGADPNSPGGLIDIGIPTDPYKNGGGGPIDIGIPGPAPAPGIDPVIGVPVFPIGTQPAPVAPPTIDPVIGVPVFPIGAPPPGGGIMPVGGPVATAGPFLPGAGGGAAARATAGGSSEHTLSAMVDNIMVSVANTPNLISSTSFIAGIGCGLTALFKLKDHVDKPGQTPLREGLIRLGTAGALLSLPFVVTAMQGTITGGAQVASTVQPTVFTALLASR